MSCIRTRLIQVSAFVALLSFGIIVHGASPIYDVTKSVDNILNNKEDVMVVMGALNHSNVLLYSTDDSLYDFLFWKLQSVKQVVSSVHAILNEQNVVKEPLLLLTLKYTKKTIDDPTGVVTISNLRNFVFGHKAGILNNTFGIVFVWEHVKSCEGIWPGYSVVNGAGVGLLLQYKLSSIKIGFGYNEVNIGCSVFLRNQLDNADFALLTIDFESGVKFAESYGMFEEYMNYIGERNQRFLQRMELKKKQIVIFKPRLRTEKKYKLGSKYEEMLCRFTSKWATRYNQHVVLEGRCTLPNNSLANPSTSNKLTGENVMTYFQQESKDSRCSELEIRSVVGQVAPYFHSLVVTFEDWERALSCDLVWKADGSPRLCRNARAKPLQILVDVDWSSESAKSLDKDVQNLLTAHLSQCDSSFPLTGFVFKDAFLEYMSRSVERQQKMIHFLDDQSSPQIAFGCLTYFGALKRVGVNDDLLLMEILSRNIAEEGKGDILNATSIFVWEFDLDMDDAATLNFNFSYRYYVDTIQRKLNVVYGHKRKFQELHQNKTVILKLATKRTSDSSIPSENLYCNNDTLKMNRYYEAITTWAQIHDFPVILKEATESYRGRAGGGWWRQLALPQGMISPPNRSYSRRNYPKGGPRSPCLRWTSKVEVLPDSLGGVTLNTNLKDGDMRIEEFHTMLRFCVHRFEYVQVPLTDDAMITTFTSVLKTFHVPSDEASSIFIQIDADHMNSDRTKLLSTALVNSDAFHSRSIQISNWELQRDDAQFQEKFRKFFEQSSGKGIKVGLTLKNCVTQVNNLIESKTSLFLLRNKDYFNLLVCEESTNFNASNDDKVKLANYLEGHLVIQNTLREYVRPNLKVYFWLNTSLCCENKERERTGHLLRFTNDVVQFAQQYEMNYWIMDAFGNGRSSAWWRVNNVFEDLFNSSEYAERESEYWKEFTWRPDTTLSWNESLYRSLPFGEGDGHSSSESTNVAITVVGFGLALIVITVLAVGFIMRMRRKQDFLTSEELEEFFHGRRHSQASRDSQNMYEVDCTSIKFNREYEIDKTQFQLDKDNTLGQGNFGTVYKAVVNGEKAAVKMPLIGCTKDCFRSILTEVKILGYIGDHPNVVKFIGAYTKEIRRGVLFVATELCENGCLHSFLRRKQQSLLERHTEMEAVINFQQLITFGREIACGMEYITAKRVIHGDLSARNVLLDEYNNCKIADFGLSRKLYEYTKYVKTNQEPLPWRWMAYESLKLMEFTSMSDVWSFGVTLWEIFSLGDIPYPGLTWTVDFMDEIKSGVRMKQPDHGTDEIYDIMCQCWDIRPSARPTFTQLSEFFVKLRNREYCLLEEG